MSEYFNIDRTKVIYHKDEFGIQYDDQYYTEHSSLSDILYEVQDEIESSLEDGMPLEHIQRLFSLHSVIMHELRDRQTKFFKFKSFAN